MSEICWNSDSLPLSSLQYNLSLILSLKQLNTSFTSFHMIFHLNYGCNWMKWRRIIEHKFYTFCMNRWIFVFNQSLEYIGGSSFHAAIVTILSSATRQLHSPATIWNDEKARLCTLTTTANCILFSIHLWTSIIFLYIPECKMPRPQNT